MKASSAVASSSSAAESHRKRKQSDVETKARLSAHKKKKQFELEDRSLSTKAYSLRAHPTKLVAFQAGGNTQHTHGRCSGCMWLVCKSNVIAVIIFIVFVKEKLV